MVEYQRGGPGEPRTVTDTVGNFGTMKLCRVNDYNCYAVNIVVNAFPSR
jgi:hypothetical protein